MKKNSFVGGTLIASLSIVITKVLGMLYVIPFYKMVGVLGSALYSYAYSIYAIVLDISTCGIPIAISKLVNEYDTLGLNDKKEQVYNIGNRIMGILAVCSFLIVFLGAPLIANVLVGNISEGNSVDSVTKVIRFIAVAILIVPFLSVSKGYLQGHNNMEISGISQIIEQIVRISIVLIGSFLVLKVFKGSIVLAICIAVLGAFFGALVSFIYVKLKIGIKVFKQVKMNRDIIKRLVIYAIPFIIINVSYSLYNFVDMTIILRLFSKLNYSGLDVEFISSSISTWAPKINMIVTSLAMGMSMSLIPVIVNLFTLGKMDGVNEKVNQSLQIIIFISLPLTIMISYYSGYFWNAFYGYNEIGTMILKVNIWLGIMVNLLMTLSSVLQGLNKFKLVYKSTISGFVCNILLDIPLVFLFDKIGYGYLGTIISSIIGYGLSVIWCLYGLKVECNLCYDDTLVVIKKMVLPTLLLFVCLLVLDKVIVFYVYSKFNCLVFILFSGLVSFLIYFFVCFRNGIVTKVFGRDIIKKLTFGKISI